VTQDLDPRVHLNTAVAGLMELVNELYAYAETRGVRPLGVDDEPRASVDRRETAAVLREAVEALVLMLSPFTPHMCEELWEQLGHADGVVAAGWPSWDDAVAREESIEIPVQVNGKVRARISVPADSTPAANVDIALASADVQRWIEGKTIVKTIHARIDQPISIVVKG
jgi:leucyl-tRNA synthetase